MKDKSVAILIDGSNLYASIHQLGLTIDYRKLRSYFGSNVVRAAYFTALPPADEPSDLRPMVDWLSYNGWVIYQKEIKVFTDPDGKRKVKGNMDIEIAVVALELATHVTDLILFSGDGDFRFLVEALQRNYGVRVTVVSTIQSRPPMIADILRRQADTFIDLVDLHTHVGRNRDVPVAKFKFGG